MTETITFTRFGETHSLDVLGECPETGLPLVEMDGKLTGVSTLETQGRRWSDPPAEPVTLREVISFLKFFECSSRPELPSNYSASFLSDRTAIVEVIGVYWMITDNGGELMIGRINVDEFKTSIPLNWFDERLNASTIANRIATFMSESRIDWEDRITDEEEAILAS